MKAEPAKDLQERIKEESKAYSGSVMEDEYNPLRKYTSDDLIEEIEYAFEQGANFILEEWEEAKRYNMNNMKTAEEKARDASCDYGIEDIQHRTMFASGYLQGYNEAMKWRDPKEEPPINQDIVLVKTDNDCYATAYFHGKESGFICYGEDAYIEFGDIIGWKPIE